MNTIKHTDSIAGMWHLVSLEGDTISDEHVWVNFAADGRFTGYTGVHSMNGRYKTEGERLEIVWLSLIRKGCMIDPTNRFEPAFLRAFKSAMQCAIKQGDLRIINSEGSEVLSFKRA